MYYKKVAFAIYSTLSLSFPFMAGKTFFNKGAEYQMTCTTAQLGFLPLKYEAFLI
jgi:hypothetical protein